MLRKHILCKTRQGLDELHRSVSISLDNKYTVMPCTKLLQLGLSAFLSDSYFVQNSVGLQLSKLLSKHLKRDTGRFADGGV